MTQMLLRNYSQMMYTNFIKTSSYTSYTPVDHANTYSEYNITLIFISIGSFMNENEN